MEKQKVELYIMANQKYFEADKILIIRNKLNQLSEDQYLVLSAIELKDPTTMLLISLFLGSFGVDRFMLGDTGMGILKLLTMGLCGILTIIDWFTISKKTKEQNFNKIMNVIL